MPAKAKPQRDYLQITKQKSKDAVWVVSHCETFSKREQYVRVLKKYISVDILGDCGKKWNCGRRYNHDACFDILNSTYRYYLAFENSLCLEYITEKFYENYEYDIIQVVRGGIPNSRPIDINDGVYINANYFKNAHELGVYLRNLSLNTTQYASMLKKKSEFKVKSYVELFKDAVCELCKRLHSVERYRFLYSDVYHWMKTKEPCSKPLDL